jgi:hypothetical protein
MDRFQQLIKALDSYGTTDLIDYWASYHSSDIKSDLIRLGQEGAPVDDTDNDLKAFTMAAMHGLCSSLPDIKRDGLVNDDIQFISKAAISIAKATLEELSKHQ